MRRVWREHSLSIILAVILVAWLAAGTWATWTEWRTNESAGAEDHVGFWTWTFAAYWFMQLAMNYVPEVMGLLTAVLLTKRFRERFSAEAPVDD